MKKPTEYKYEIVKHWDVNKAKYTYYLRFSWDNGDNWHAIGTGGHSLAWAKKTAAHYKIKVPTGGPE